MVSKSFWIIRYHDSVDCFFLTGPKNLWRTLQCFKKIRAPKKTMHKRGVQRFSVDNFSLTVPRSFVGGTLLSFRKVLVRKKFMDKRGRVSSFFLEVFFCPKSPKNIVGEPICVSELFWYQKFLDTRGFTILSFVLISQYRKTSWGNDLFFRKFPVRKKFMDKKGRVTSSRRSFFVPNRRKFSCANPSAFQKCSGINSFYIIRESQFFNFFLSHIAKNDRGRTRLCFRNILVSKFSDNRGITILSIVFVSKYQKICREPSIDSKSLGHPNNL